MAVTLPTSRQPSIKERHEFGPGIIRELAKYLYKSPKSAYKEAVSNALDQMPKDDAKVEIYTDVPPHGDIVIEDWGTGIEDLQRFKHIAIGDKIVDGRVSSYKIIDENIIGQKGLGKLSFLNLSSVATVEFYSHSKKVGMKIVMTDELDGFTSDPINNIDALPHPGVKLVIKQARKKLITEGELMKYLSKIFAIRIARGAKIFVNGNRVTKPEGFDSKEYPLFQLDDGTAIKGNLKAVEKPQLNNIDIFVKNVYVDSKGFDFKVEGWLNYNKLLLTSSRDSVHEEGVEYEKFMQGLTKHLDESYERKTESKDQHIQAQKQIEKMFVTVISSILDVYPDMAKPLMAGSPSGEIGIGTLSNNNGDAADPCVEQQGIIDTTKTSELTIGKPIGGCGTGHKRGIRESMARIIKGDGRILAPLHVLPSGNDMIPEPKLILGKSEDKPLVYYSAPNRLVVNEYWSSSEILIKANPRDPNMKSRVLPLLVRAGIDAYPGASEMSREEWFRRYDVVLDRAWSR
jgi:Histidine kinase-, DNA gyrase B-, and HSP90-like ATPase